MRGRLKLAAVLAFIAAVPLLMAPSGGFPFYPFVGGINLQGSINAASIPGPGGQLISTLNAMPMTGAAPSGGDITGRNAVAQINISSDTADSTANVGNPTINILDVQDAPNTGHNGGRNGIMGHMDVVGTPTAAPAAGYTGVVGFTRTNSNLTGTSTSYSTYAGGIFGLNGVCWLQNGATFITSCIGAELDARADTGSSPAEKHGLILVKLTNDAVQGAFDDSALEIADQNGPSEGWNIGVEFGATAHHWPFVNTSTLIKVTPRTIGGSETANLLNVVDSSGAALAAGGCNFKGALNTNGPVSSAAGAFCTDPILCTTACNVSGMLVGQSAYIRKTAATSRASTVTLALDPDLQFTNVPIGSYRIEYDLGFHQGGASAGGIVIATGGTATSSASLVALAQPPINVGSPVGTGAVTCTNTTFYTITGANLTGTTGNASAGAVQGQCSITVAGSVGLQWAQQASNATATSLDPSMAVLTRIN